jgi:hypothetical protein
VPSWACLSRLGLHGIGASAHAHPTIPQWDYLTLHHKPTECSKQYRGKDDYGNYAKHFDVTFFDIHIKFSLAVIT